MIENHPEYKQNKEVLKLAEKSVQLALDFGNNAGLDSVRGLFGDASNDGRGDRGTGETKQ